MLLKQVAEALLAIWPKHHDSSRMSTPLLRTLTALLRPDNLTWLEQHHSGILGAPSFSGAQLALPSIINLHQMTTLPSLPVLGMKARSACGCIC